MSERKKDLLACLLLFLIVAFISYKNYTPKTFLTGIDNFHIEYDLNLALQRSIFGVWQEFQGVGLTAGLAHASDLPRVLLYYLFSLFLPLSFIRYFYIFLCLFIGPLGVYFLAKRLNIGLVGSFLASLFYFFNLATLQNFFMPTEMFVTHYGFIPWLFLGAFRFLDSGKKKDLIIFSLLTFVSSPQAMTPTLFLAYFGAVLIVLVGSVSKKLANKVPRFSLKKETLLFVSILVMNAYWAIPFAYFSFSNSTVVIDSRINQLSSEETFLRNKKYGDIKDVALLKGAWFDYQDLVNGKFVGLFYYWEKHLSKPYVLLIGYILFSFVVFGVLASFVLKVKYRVELTFILLLGLFMLMNENPPLGFVFHFLRGFSPLFRESLRFPFTKFSILTAFMFSLFFGISVFFIQRLLSKLKVEKLIILPAALLLSGLLFFNWPMFEGYLLSPGVRVSVPQDYFDMFAFFKKQPSGGRIMNLPQYKYWAWDYYNWGYRGSGFLWYGLSQPVLDRAFDVWNSKNEAYYRELSYAIYSHNDIYLRKILQKYGIGWIILDKNVIHTDDPNILQTSYLENLLNKSNLIAFKKDFGNISVYKTLTTEDKSNFVFGVNDYTKVNSSYSWSFYDQAFSEYGNYIKEKEENSAFVFKDFSATSDGVTFLSDYDVKGEGELRFNVPDYSKYEKRIPVILKGSTISYLLPTVEFSGKVLNKDVSSSIALKNTSNNLIHTLNERVISQDLLYLSTISDNPLDTFDLTKPMFSLDLTRSFLEAPIERCEDQIGGVNYGKNIKDSVVGLFGEDVLNCLNVNINPKINSKRSLLVYVEFEYWPSSDEQPSVCLQKSGSFECLNKGWQKNVLHPSTRLVWNKYSRFVKISDLNEATLWLSLRLDSRASGSKKSIDYKNIKLSIYPSIDELTYSRFDVSKDLSNAYSIYDGIINKGNIDLKVTLPEGWGDSFTYDISKVRSSDCSFVTSSTVTKYIEYNAKDTECLDSFAFPDADYSLGYVISIKNESLYGRLFNFCLASTETGFCDLDESLKEQIYFVPSSAGGKGYTVHLSYNPIGGESAQLRVYNISLKQMPFAWLKAFRIAADNSTFTEGDLRALSVLHPAPFFYSITMEGGKGDGLLVLNQSFDRGWVAFCGLTPCKSSHVLVNNWANGWVVEDTIDKLIIVFWPQFLEFFGFFLIICFGASLLKYRPPR